MKMTSIRELDGIPYGRVLTWGEKPIRYVVKRPDEIGEYSLYFCSENEEEAGLLEKMKGCGASGVVVWEPCRFRLEEWKAAGVGIIETDNPIMFQIELAKIIRTKFDLPMVQVIGSAGKTTAKDMIGAVLNAGMPTLVGYANYNTAFGAASNLLSLRENHKAAVLEAGTKSKGYMSFSTGIIRPNIAVLTSIQRAHYVTLGSIGKIIEAKSEILDFLDENSLFIVNGEDGNCRRFPLETFRGRIVRYGFSDQFDVWATDITYRDFKTYFTVRTKELRFKCLMHTVGKYNVLNALAAVAVGLELKLTPQAIRRGLARFEPMARRMKIVRGPLNTTIVDDNFNANPDSMRLFLEDIPKYTGGRPVMLVLGDVERPDERIRGYAEKIHFMIGQQLGQVPFYKLIAVGKWAEEYVRGARSRGVPPSSMEYFESVEQAEDSLVQSLVPGSVIFFKASVYVPVRNLIHALNRVGE